MTYTLQLEEKDYELVKSLLGYGLDKACELIAALAKPEEEAEESEESEETQEVEDTEEVEASVEKPQRRKAVAVPEGMLNASQARQKLNLTSRQLYDQTSRGLIPSEKIGHRLFWKDSDLDAYLAKQP